MKKILIPTDFSAVADNAMSYAVEIAAGFKSELFLYHAYLIGRVDYKLDLSEDEQPVKREMERKMELTKMKFADRIREKGLTVHTIVKHDIIYALFKNETKNYGIDLILMGSSGASGLEKAIFGSVAATALDLSKVPVLIVPPGYSFRQLKHIVVAMDRQELSAGVLAPVRKLAAAFGATVTGLHINTGTGKSTDQQIGRYLKDIPTTYRELPVAGSVNNTINAFIRENNCDLLCMVRREKGFFKDLFRKSITTAQAYTNSIPLLVLPEKPLQ